jgi:2'-5' RNA ligase
LNLHGIASRLSPEYEDRVRGIWAALASECGLTAIAKTPTPHFSWVVGEGFDFELLENELAGFARNRARIEARTTGLGVFTGAEDIVLYIAMIKDESLAGFHRAVWDLAAPRVQTASPYYAPSGWVPHITLAHGDTDPDRLACAARLLARTNLHWTFPVTEISLVYQEEDRAEEIARFHLQL